MHQDRRKKFTLAKHLTDRADYTATKIEAQQEKVVSKQQAHKQTEPEQPLGWWGRRKYKQLKKRWETIKEHITGWALERMDTLNKRLDRIAPYLNHKTALERATEKIDNQNQALAELYEKHRAMLKEQRSKERQRAQEAKEQQQEQRTQEAHKQEKKPERGKGQDFEQGI